MKDNRLNELYAQKLSIDAQIRTRKKKIAREKGQVVDSIDELTCEKHSDAIFEVIDTISDSWICTMGEEGKEGLNIYQCNPCSEDKKAFIKTKAYDCPSCGIVIGNFERRDYRSSEESWRALAGREGEHYHCKICDTQLGSFYWAFS